MEFLPEPFRSIASFLVVLGVLIFIHELGHYLAARWRGVHVERFSIGFGRALYTKTDKRGCEWRIGWLPLGGYVKMHGMEDLGEAAPEQAAAFRPGETFHEKSVGDRALVVAAGPFFNFALAVLLFAGLSWVAVKLLRRMVNEATAPRWMVLATRQVSAHSSRRPPAPSGG